MGYLTLALSVGTLLTAGFLLPDLDDASCDAIWRRRRGFSSALSCSSAILAVLVQGAKLSAGALPSLDVLIRYLTRTQSGQIWLAREIYVVFLLGAGHGAFAAARFLSEHCGYFSFWF